MSSQSFRGRLQTQGSTSGPCSSSSLRCGAKRPTGTTPSPSAPPRSTTRHSGTGMGKKLFGHHPMLLSPTSLHPFLGLTACPRALHLALQGFIFNLFGAHCPSHELHRLHRLPAVPSLPLSDPDAAVGASPSPPFPCPQTLNLGICNWELKA